jgi:hypothetical protein
VVKCSFVDTSIGHEHVVYVNGDAIDKESVEL